MRKVTTLTGKPGWPAGVIDFAERKASAETDMVEKAFRIAGVDPEQADKVLAYFTRVCDQTGLSEKLRKD